MQIKKVGSYWFLARSFLYSAVSVFILFLVAIENVQSDELEIKKIAKELKKIVPGDVEADITPGPISNLFQVVVDNRVFYVTADFAYLFRGDVIDLQNKQNLTEGVRRNSRAEILFSIDKNELISFFPKKSTTKNEIYVFTDIDCTYCRKFHLEVPELNAAGVTVHYLAFPRKGVDSASSRKAQSVWCSENSREVLTQAKLGKNVPAKRCPNTVADQFKVGIKIGVMGTPAIYASNGEELGGYLSARDVIKKITR